MGVGSDEFDEVKVLGRRQREEQEVKGSQGYRSGLRAAAALRLKTLLVAAYDRWLFALDGAFVLDPGRKPWVLPNNTKIPFSPQRRGGRPRS